MNLKSLYKAYYHQLYDAIKYLDQEAINRTGQSAIRLLNTNIDQLSALISLLIHVDETLPLIRCQGALGRFKKDFADLYLNYLEANLVKAHPELLRQSHGPPVTPLRLINHCRQKLQLAYGLIGVTSLKLHSHYEPQGQSK